MKMTELSEILRENGVVGAGGAGFPTYAKLAEGTDTILMNCAECEPLLKLHRQLLGQKAPEILKAFAMVADAVGAKEAIIGIKEEYKSTIEALKEYIDAYPKIRIHELPGAYPMGDEVVLIYEATGRRVPAGGLPIQCGVAVFNVETMYNIYQAVWQKHPVTEKCVTVVGEVRTPITLWAALGTQVKELVAAAGGVTAEDPVYLLGGPMMGAFGSQETAVTKTTNAIIVLPRSHSLVQKKTRNFRTSLARAASSCCQCQTCTDLCPRHNLGYSITPHLFMRAAANRDFGKMEPFLDTMYCSSCGVCENYSCPQGLQPAGMMAAYKKELRNNGIRPVTKEAGALNDARDLRRIPEKRLTARLGLLPYEKEAPLTEMVCCGNMVKIGLNQHIGAGAIPVVKEGDRVVKGQVIAKAAEGLSVNIHGSRDGNVLEVTDRYIRIG